MDSPGERPSKVRLREEELAETILQYLAERPNATDTLEGIAGWWIPRQRVQIEVGAVSRALGHLTERGLLECLGTGMHRRYRLKPPIVIDERPADPGR
jgi:hypothetical protein